MTFRRLRTVVGVLAFAAFAAGVSVGSAGAQDNTMRILSIQGEITDAVGTPVDGTLRFVTRLWTGPETNPAAEEVFRETHAAVEVQQGIYEILMGTGLVERNGDGGPEGLRVGIDLSVFKENDLWFGLQVEDDLEMIPRRHMASVAHAMNASMLGGKPASDYVRVSGSGAAIDLGPGGTLTLGSETIDEQLVSGIRALFTPTLLQPAEGAVLEAHGVELAWTSGAAPYLVEVTDRTGGSGQPDFSGTLVFSQNGIAANSISIPDLEGTYSWRVTAQGYGQDAVSKVGTFSVVAPPPLGTPENPARSCAAIAEAGDSTGTGSYTLDTGSGPFQAYCNMAIDQGGWTLIAKVSGTDEKRWGCLNTPGCNGSFWVGGGLHASTSAATTNEDAKYPAYPTVRGRDVMFYDMGGDAALLYVNDLMNDQDFGSYVGGIPDPGACGGCCAVEKAATYVKTGTNPFCGTSDCSGNARLGAFCRDEESWDTRDFILFTLISNDPNFDYNVNKRGIASDFFDSGHGGGASVDVSNGVTFGEERRWSGVVGILIR